MLGLREPVLFYGVKNAHGYLSNFAQYPITLNGKTFNCNEQFIMYSKASMFSDQESMKQIMRATNPAAIKKLGRGVKGFKRDQWEPQIPVIADLCNMAKFSQHAELTTRLLSTGEAVIAEASPTDRIWGIGVDAEKGKDVRTWRGDNLLGKSLMRIRKQLRAQLENKD
jgi:ribA/ribD-fused uncharacterized protein